MLTEQEPFLKILGGGYGRTGTLSLQKALNYLGYHCHHMETVIMDPTQKPDIFKEAYKDQKKAVNWTQAYKGYDAAVDWPTVAFFDTLYALNPDAKVILTVRDAEKWYQSISKTIYEWPGVDETWPKQVVQARNMARVIVRDGEIGSLEKEALKQKFMSHIEHVKSTVKPDNLLIMEVGEGWEKLCPFLGKPVPDIPYPHCNKGDRFGSLLQTLRSLIDAHDQESIIKFNQRMKDI